MPGGLAGGGAGGEAGELARRRAVRWGAPAERARVRPAARGVDEGQGAPMGRKQVAEELEWTAAKTSQVVTGLRDDDDLDGFRLGRENVLSLPEYDAGPDGDDGETEDESE